MQACHEALNDGEGLELSGAPIHEPVHAEAPLV
jgi:hypothetical protein